MFLSILPGTKEQINQWKNSSSNGGSINYYDKYLKYKDKYLELKNNLS